MVRKREKMSETSSVSPTLNKTMKFILRSPLHRVVSKFILLISFTGRKSGKTYTTPVSYSQENDQVTIFTHATWWKNLRGGAPVTLRIRGRELHGFAEPVAEDKQAIAAELMAHLRKSPFDAKFYDVTFDDQGNPRAEDIEQAVQSVVMIRVQLG
jgi:deazaflavin-dependent oxidoreductase (nitroreductase family)